MEWQELFTIRLNHGYLLQILFAELLYMQRLPKKGHFAVRFGTGLPFYVLGAVALPNLIAGYVSGWFSITIFVLSLLFCRLCFQGNREELLFCAISALFTQNLAIHIEYLVTLPIAGKLPVAVRFLLSVGVFTVVYGICYRVFACRFLTDNFHWMGRTGTFVMISVTVIFVYFIQYMFQVYQMDGFWFTRLPMILCSVFGLCVQFGILELKTRQAENQMLEQMMIRERKKYERMKDSIDLINMKVHDLKHYIARAHSMKGMDQEELQELETIVKTYEQEYHTGNEELDVILTEKQMLCEKHQIAFSSMVDGQAFSFLRPAEIAALFGNALDNAIEYEMGIPEAEKRCITLKIFQKGKFACVRIENYCTKAPETEHGQIVTSKEDKNYHGFGLKSIRYIVEKHGGNMRAGLHVNMFAVHILFPLPDF